MSLRFIPILLSRVLLRFYLIYLFTYTIGYRYSINLPFDNIVCSLTLLMLLFNIQYVYIKFIYHL